jgi:hypothetical protein
MNSLNSLNSKISTVISFDIGLVNLAFCVANIKHDSDGNKSKSITILDWKLYDLNTKNAEKGSATCIALFKNAFANMQDTNNVWVLIERQLPVNTQCMCISHTVFAFFLSCFEKVNVSFVNSISKPLVGKKRQRKKESVILTREYLENESSLWLPWFNKQNKKDDLADAFTQILGNLPNIKYNTIEAKEEAPEVIIIDD